jgi:hypothetical protein
VIGYEEKESRVIDRMKTGYPRFFLHPLIQRVCEVLAPAEGFEVLPFSDEIAAQECAALTGGTAKMVNGIPAAFFPSNAYQLQHITCPHSIYEKLASNINSFLYKTLKLYLGIPTRLLHLPPHLGGFGIPDLSTYVQKT